MGQLVVFPNPGNKQSKILTEQSLSKKHMLEYSNGEEEDRGTLGLGCERAYSLLLSPYRLEEKPAVHPLGICSAG